MNKSTFEKELEGKCFMQIDDIHLCEGGKREHSYKSSIILTARDKALEKAEKELGEWEVCNYCMKKPKKICYKKHYVFVPLVKTKEILRRHFGKSELKK